MSCFQGSASHCHSQIVTGRNIKEAFVEVPIYKYGVVIVVADYFSGSPHPNMMCAYPSV